MFIPFAPWDSRADELIKRKTTVPPIKCVIFLTATKLLKYGARLSPDGKIVIVEVIPFSDFDAVWYYDNVGKRPRRLLAKVGEDQFIASVAKCKRVAEVGKLHSIKRKVISDATAEDKEIVDRIKELDEKISKKILSLQRGRRPDVDGDFPFYGVDEDGNYADPPDEQTLFDWAEKYYTRHPKEFVWIAFRGGLFFKKLLQYSLACGLTREDFQAEFGAVQTDKNVLSTGDEREKLRARGKALQDLERQSEYVRRLYRGAFECTAYSYFRPDTKGMQGTIFIPPDEVILATRENTRKISAIYMTDFHGYTLPPKILNAYYRELEKEIVREAMRMLQKWKLHEEVAHVLCDALLSMAEAMSGPWLKVNVALRGFRLLFEVQKIVALSPDRVTEDGPEAFDPFRRAVTQASRGRDAPPSQLLGPVESKEMVLKFLVALHGSKKMYRRQVVAVMAVLMHEKLWLRSLLQIEGFPENLSEDLRLIVEEEQKRMEDEPEEPELPAETEEAGETSTARRSSRQGFPVRLG
eukprot:s557_g12.t1